MVALKRAPFVVVEGGEGSGKSRLITALHERLRDGGYDVVCTREPGGTPFGERIRELILASGEVLEPLSELLLFEAARAELVATVILPALQNGRIVLCDRFTASSIAYQCGGRGIPRELVDQANAIATDGATPDLTLLLDVPAEEGLRRRTNDGGMNRFDHEEVDFHQRVNEMFRSLAREDPARWRVLDATRDFTDVVTAATASLDDFLALRRA